MVYVLYHFPCSDGFGAAWAVHDYYRNTGTNVTYIGVNYGQDPPAIPDGSTVLIVDFSYDRKTLYDLADRSEKVVVLDHHKTAEKELGGNFMVPGNLHITFDMEHSGAVLAWRYLFPDKGPPNLLRYVEDRDLWKWELKDSGLVNAAIGSYPADFDTWDGLHDRLKEPEEANKLRAEGGAILRARDKEIGEIVDTSWLATVGGHRVPIANVLNSYSSDVCHRLLETYPDAPFAATFHDSDDTRTWSARSRGSFDVSELAEGFGGGGHHGASGWREALHA